MRRYPWKEWGGVIKREKKYAEFVEQAKDKFTKDIRTAAVNFYNNWLYTSRDYFEAIPQRFVPWSDWKYAVVPHDTEAEVIEKIESYGVKVVFADSLKEGLTLIEAQDSTVSFSVSTQQVSRRWRGILQQYESGAYKRSRELLGVCPTPSVLQMLGANPYTLAISVGVLDKVITGKHAVPISEIAKLPEALSKPIAVFSLLTQDNSMVVLTELKEGSHNVIVAVHLDVGIGRMQINRIASLYGKRNVEALFSMPMLYCDNKKFAPWIKTTGRLQLPAVGPSKGRSVGKIYNPKDLHK